jgi:DeoR family ulaG and ulaABCDEF operon transcriptional repressor
MLEHERKKTILRLLDLRSFANIHDVVETTGASEATIRRDFHEMEREKVVRRVRGGVELVRARGPGSAPLLEPPLDHRLSVNQEKKRRIARKACGSIHDGDTIMIDGGSTTFQMVEHLAQLSITVITNSFAIAQHLVTHSRCMVILPEGIVNPDSKLILNNLSADAFANYHASKAFMGIEGITDTVLTNSEPRLIQMERAMIDHSQELIILADDSKFGMNGHITLCAVERASRIITTKDADPALVSRLREKGIEIVLA